MNLERWLAAGRLRSHKTTQEEIQELLKIAQRDLSDAAIKDLSVDRRFLIAYEAALTLATIPLHCSGYETHGQGHHWITFKALPEVMGEESAELADYFDVCRTKRNVGMYDRGGQISATDVEEILSETRGFQEMVFDWLRSNHPNLV